MILTQYDAEFHFANERRILREEGEQKKLIGQVCRKFQKGKSSECIADDWEEELAVISRIVLAAEQYAPEYDVDKIYQAMKR